MSPSKLRGKHTSDMTKMAHRIQTMISATWTGPGYSGSAEAADSWELRELSSDLLSCGVSTRAGPLNYSAWSPSDAFCPSIVILWERVVAMKGVK